MSQDEIPIAGLFTESSRRSFMKKGAVASGAVGLGLTGASGAVAQDDDGDDGDDGARALMFSTQFYAGAQFEFVSEPIDWAPVETDEGGDDWLGDEDDDLLFDEADLFANYDTRIIQYAFATQNYALLFVQQGANVQQGRTYELSPAFEVYGQDDADVDDDLLFDDGNELGLVAVQYDPADGAETTPADGTPTGTETTAADRTETTTTEE